MTPLYDIVRLEAFTFTPQDGEEVHILSGMLRQFLLEYARHRVIDLTFPEETQDEIYTRHGIEPSRMATLTEAEAQEPVIIAIFPGNSHILVDGGHRRAYWAARGINTIKGWAVPEVIWRQFLFDPSDPGSLGAAHIFNADPGLLPHRRRG